MTSHTLNLALRSLRARPMRTILTTFGIVLGVAVILAISISNLSTLGAISTLFSEASGKAHLVVTRAGSTDEPLPEGLLRRVGGVPGVGAAIPSVHGQAFPSDEAPAGMSLNLFGSVAGGLTLYGIDPSVDREAREYRIVDGTFLPPDHDAYEVVLVKEYADEKNLRVGSDLSIRTPEGEDTLRVVGLMSKEGPGQLNNGAFGVVPLRVAQQVFGEMGRVDQIDIVATPGVASGTGLDNLKAAVQERIGSQYSVIYPATQGRRVIQMLSAYQIGLSFFSGIALFVGAFLIYNAFSMTVVERTREIGMLRTVGMTRRQVMQQILVEAGILGLIGSALGILAGIFLSQGLIRMMEFVLAQEVKEVRIPPEGLLTSVLVGLVVTLVAAAIPAWQAGRISPLEALRIRGNPREGWIIHRGWLLGVGLLAAGYLLLYWIPLPPALVQASLGLIFVLLLGATLLVPISVGISERVARPWMRRVYGREGQLGSRNAERARLRTTLTVAALMIGVAMILAVRTVTSAFDHDLRAWIGKYIGGDLYVHSSLPMRPDLAQRLETVAGVSAVTPIRYFDVKRLKPDGGDESLAFMAFDPQSYPQVTSFVFTPGQGEPERLLDRLAAGDSVFISSVLAEKYGLKPGDSMRLATRRGERDFQIAATVVDFYAQGMVVQGSWNDMRRYFGLNDVSAFLVKTQPGTSLESVRDRVNSVFGERSHLNTESNQALRDRALSLLDQTGSMFDVLALIAMIVATLGVINTLTMNVLERTQEIGMLRSLGMTRRQVGKMILAEAGMMGLIGGAFGLIFGIIVSHTIVGSMNRMTGYDLTYVLPVQGVIVSVLLALLVSQLAALWPAQRAAGLRIIEAIQFE